MAEISPNARMARVDMTPMVDLGFLLITFFMFTTSFYTEHVVKFALPDSDAGTPPPIKESNSLSLILGQDNRIFWHQKNYNALNTSYMTETRYGIELRKLIVQKRNAAIEPDSFTVLIKPSDESNYQNTITILDEMLLSNQKRYVLADISPVELKVYDAKSKP